MNLRIHPQTCEERISGWERMKHTLAIQSQLRDGMTFKFCELLASYQRRGALWA